MSFSFLSQVESDPQKLVVFIWDFQIKDTLHSSGIVKPLLEYDGDDPFPTMPWLDVSKVRCNCSNYPVFGEVLQNSNTNLLPDHLPEQGADGYLSVPKR